MDEVSKALPDLVWLTDMTDAGRPAHDARAGPSRPTPWPPTSRTSRRALTSPSRSSRTWAASPGRRASTAGKWRSTFTYGTAGAGTARAPPRRAGRGAEAGGIGDGPVRHQPSKIARGTTPSGSASSSPPCSRAPSTGSSSSPSRPRSRPRRSSSRASSRRSQKGRAAERKLAQFREEVKRLELELAKLLQILPSKRNTEELIKRIETLTRQGDFTLLKFTPGEFIQKDFYAEWPIDIQIQGTYHNLALFFDRMSRFSRIVNVEDMKVATLDNVPRQVHRRELRREDLHLHGRGTRTPSPPGPRRRARRRRPAAPAANAQSLKERAEGGGVE